MGDAKIVFDHIHVISKDPESAASWYADVLGGEIANVVQLRGAPQYRIVLDGITILVRGQRPGEQPDTKMGDREFADGYLHAPQWGTDHFGFHVHGALDEFCDGLRYKGATFSVEPHEFLPGVRIAYVEAPDGVHIELVQVKR